MKKNLFSLLAALLAMRVGAQTLDVDWFTVDGGGGASSDGTLNVIGTAGQPDAGTMSDGILAVQGGFWPAFSQTSSPGLVNGYKIYFSVQSGTAGSNYIGVVNNDGSGFVHVLDMACWPRVSRDGGKMLYHPVTRSTGNFAQNDLALFDFATSNSVTLFNNTDYVVSYDWANDNTNAYFDYACSMLTVNAQTHIVGSLFSATCFDDAPSVNPQDGNLVFHNQSGLWLVNKDASNRRQVPNSVSGEYWPVWSPDGQSLAFLSLNSPGNYGYWITKPDGTGRTNLWTKIPGASMAQLYGQNYSEIPAFSPDGQWVIAAFNLNGTNGIYAMAADGSGAVQTIFTPPNSGDQIVNWIGNAFPTTLVSATPPTLTIVAAGSGLATISWTPASPGFVLQESDGLAPANWSNSASGAQNPVIVQTGSATKFYRLLHP